jgi:hypothetical protein
MLQAGEEGVITPMTLVILLEEALEVSEEAVEAALMAMEIKALGGQAVNLTGPQRLLVEKPLVVKVDRIQEVAEEVLGTTKQEGVADRGLFIFVTQS